jgi:hypothetical protein
MTTASASKTTAASNASNASNAKGGGNGAAGEHGAAPRSQTGTIIGVPKRKLVVDGAAVHGSVATVTCGKHSVKVGAARAAHVVDVPCGGKINVR